MGIVDEQRLLDNLPDGGVVLDVETETIVAVNETFCDILGYDRADLVGEPVATITAGRQDRDRVPTPIETHINQAHDRDSVQFIWQTETAEGSGVPLETHLTVVDDGSNVSLATVRTISERTDPSDSDHDHTATARYRRILDYLSDYVLIVDETGIIRYSSPGVEDALGHEPSRLVGTDAFKYVHPADEQETKAAFEDMLENPAIETTIEYRGQTSDGSYRWIEARGSNYLADPMIDGVLVTIRDITDRKRYERRIETQNQMLERLASIVSHDLKTPVSTAGKLVTLLRGAIEDPDSDVEQSLEKLDAVLDDLRAFADHLPTLAHQSTHVEDPIECELNEVARSAWNAVDTGSITLDFDGNRVLDGDPRRLRQVFQNLFENVTTHAPDATVVTVGTLPDGFYVADDGPGIETSTVEDVFAYGTTSGAGTGVGLAIVQTIVEAHGWAVTVTESDTGGARFEIYTDPE